MGSRVPAHKVQRGVRRRLEMRFWQSRWQWHTEAVPIPARVLDRDYSWLAAQRHEIAVDLRQFVSRSPPVDVGARVDLIDRQITEPKQEIVHAVHGRARQSSCRC